MILLALSTSWLTGFAVAVSLVAALVVWLDAVRRHRDAPKDLQPTSLDLNLSLRPGVDLTILSAASHGAGTSKQVRQAIEAKDDTALKEINLLVLGRVVASGQGRDDPHSKLLGVRLSEDESSRVLLPVFTQMSVLRDALVLYPEWGEQSMLELSGAEILGGLTEGVGFLVDPGSHDSAVIEPDSPPPLH